MIHFVHIQMFLTFSAFLGARVLFSLFALDSGASPLQVGVLAAGSQLAPVLLAFHAGRLVDRLGSRRPLVVAAMCGMAGILLPYLLPGMPALFAGSVLLGIWTTGCVLVSQALLRTLSEPARLANNLAVYGTYGALTMLVGPPLAGFAIDHVGHLNACLWLLPFPLAVLLMLAYWGAGLPPGTRSREAPAKLLDTLADRHLWWVIAVSGAVQLAMELFPFYLPIYAHGIGLSASAIGLVLACLPLSTLAVRPLMPRLLARFGDMPLLGYSFALAALAFAMVPLFRDPVLLGLVAALFGLGIACGQPLTLLLLMKRAAKDRVAEAMGLRVTATGILRLVAPSLFGGLAASLGMAAVFAVTGALLFGCAWATLHPAKESK